MKEISRRRLITAGSTVAIMTGIGAAGAAISNSPVPAGGSSDIRAREAARDLTRKDLLGNSLTPVYTGLLTGLLNVDPRPKRVAVIGAGTAGLACADILTRAGHTVRVVEADPSRVGGRVRTLRSGWVHPGAYAEAGMSRIPDSHTLTTSLARRLGVGLRTFLTDQDSRLLVSNGQVTTRDRYSRRPRTLNQGFGVSTDLTARKVLDNALSPIDSLVKGDTWEGWTGVLSTWDAYPLQRYLADTGVTEAEQDLIGTLELLSAKMQTSVIDAYLYAKSTDPGLRVWEPVGGMDTLTGSMAEKLATGVVNKGWRVEGVDSRPVTVRLALVDKDGARDTLEADLVVFAVPFAALRHIRFTPELSYGKRRAISELHHEADTRVFLEFSRRWWDGHGGHDTSDTVLRRTLYPSHPAGDGGVICASSVFGEDTLAWDALGPRGRPEYALRALTELYGSEVRKTYTGTYDSKVWAQDPLVFGGSVAYLPGQTVGLGPDTRTPEADDRLMFAGDATSTRYRGWMEGALESACRVASAIGVTPNSKGPEGAV